jgi:hypothetical protein
LFRQGQQITRTTLGAEGWRKWFKELANHGGLDDMRRVLLGVYRELHLKSQSEEHRRQDLLQVRIGKNAPKFVEYWENLPLGWGVGQDEPWWQKSILARLRGEAIHTHLYLSKEIAAAALALAKASLDDFESVWLAHYHPGILGNAKNWSTEAPDWDDLCRWCGVDFLPPYREQEEKEDDQ